MAIEDNTAAAAPPGRTAYGRFIRERGTLKLVVGAIVLALAWYAFDSFRVARMRQVHWPALQPAPNGLTVLGLPTEDRPGHPRRYVAIESNHAWQIRRPDDAEEEDDSGGAAATPGRSDEPEARDRGNLPAAASRAARGEIVSLDEIMRTCQTVLTGAHFSGADVEPRNEPLFDQTYYIIHIGLTDEGRSRYWQYSADHDEERLAFVLNGEIMTCPVIRHMDTSSVDIGPIWVKADADRLASYLNSKHP